MDKYSQVVLERRVSNEAEKNREIKKISNSYFGKSLVRDGEKRIPDVGTYSLYVLEYFNGELETLSKEKP